MMLVLNFLLELLETFNLFELAVFKFKFVICFLSAFLPRFSAYM